MSNTYIEKIEDCLERALLNTRDQEIVVTELGNVEKYLASLKGQIGGLEQVLKRREDQILNLDRELHALRIRGAAIEKDYSRARTERDNALSRVRNLEEDLQRIKDALYPEERERVLTLEEQADYPPFG